MEQESPRLKQKCPECGIATEEKHTCPYLEEVDSDYETLCACCHECTVRACVWAM